MLLMDLRREIGNLLTESRDLLTRLRSHEGYSVNDVDLHMLRVQLSLLDIEMGNMQESRRLSASSEATNLPGVTSPSVPAPPND